MAGRPPKQSIDYAGWAVDIFDNDPKIDKLMDSQGCLGFTIYFFFCQKAYGSNGYYYSWSYDDAATTARKIGGGVGSEAVKNTVNLCFRIGLFNKDLFDRHSILTSRGIQKRYRQVALTRTDKSVIQDYWLLSKEESVGLVFCTLKSNYAAPKLNSNAPKLNYQPQKESKVKDSKGNISTPAPEPPVPPVEESRDKGRKKKAAPIFTDESDEIRLSRLLAGCMRKNNPTCKIPSNKSAAQEWCKHFNYMIRLDGHSVEEVEDMIRFSQWHQFWKKNILSPRNLREKWDRLFLERQEAEEKGEPSNVR